MPLYVKDREVGELAEKLATLTKTSKTEAVRRALRNEITHLSRQTPETQCETHDEYIERAVNLARELRGHLPKGTNPMPVTKEWIDSLYEDG